MPVVRAVLALVVPTMVAVAVDVYVAAGVPDLPALVITTMVDVPAPAAPAAPVASPGRKCLEHHLEIWTDSRLVHIMG